MKTLAIAIIAFAITGCTSVYAPVGEFQMYITVNVTDDWCEMPNGDLVNGTTSHSPKIPSVSAICISKKSDDIERTIKHELDHAWDNAVHGRTK
jgi:hypothetical protein